ncbi:hypothetical protein [Paraburkholderia sp. BCC1876]|uniref:hypothetical protein n=1 Tax=Paraburkholderia sp. BCC1876 TaxID=2676303 RepID=UPI001ABB3F4E|nr:hypothetical protein [Paraburkholderia sp. BCC1876]
MQQPNSAPRSVVSRLYCLRRYSLRLSRDLHEASRWLRGAREWRHKTGANIAMVEQQEAHWTRVMGNIGRAFIEAGAELVRLSEEIDATMTVQQRVDLIGAGRYRAGFAPSTTFSGLVANGFELPTCRKGKPRADGPLFLLLVAFHSAAIRERAARENEVATEALVAQRVEANLGFVHEPPTMLQ